MTRLDKLLAQSGLYSRSDARALIRSGSVAVNGVTVDKPETKADESAVITVLGAQVNCAEYRYFMLDKPAGVLSATEDPGQPTVLDLLPRELRALGLSPVGRLDKDTTGLLLLTNDGVVKTYIASTALPVTAEDVEAFREGLTLADGTRCLPALLEPLEGNTCKVEVSEGKYHQVKRMLASRGKNVETGGFKELRQFEASKVFGLS